MLGKSLKPSNLQESIFSIFHSPYRALTAGLNPRRPLQSRHSNEGGLGAKHYNVNGILDLKPEYLGPWTLREGEVIRKVSDPDDRCHLFRWRQAPDGRPVQRRARVTWTPY